MPTKIAITGAAGRMGQRLLAVAREDAELEVVASLVRDDRSSANSSASIDVTTTLRVTPDVLVDFSSPSGTRCWLDVARRQRIPILIGTTGLDGGIHAGIDDAAKSIPVLQAANTSLGVNVLLKVLADVAVRLGDAFDVEVVEAHHRHKKDAPSGTAEAMVAAMLNAVGGSRDNVVYGRHGGDAERKPRQIGVHALRLGDEPGTHTVHFAGAGERLEFTHRATSRDTFARGALHAAKWLARRPPGRYTMADALGLSVGSP